MVTAQQRRLLNEFKRLQREDSIPVKPMREEDRRKKASKNACREFKRAFRNGNYDC